MRARRFLGAQADQVGACEAEFRPVNWAFRQIGKADTRNGNGLAFNGAFRVPVPFVGGRNEYAARELPAAFIRGELLTRCRQEGIYVRFLDR